MLKIVWLYWKSMNIYGDYGNILALEKQLKIHGLKYQIIRYDIGDKFPEDADIVIGGGGQDSSQNKIQDDLMAIAPKLIELAKKGVPMLMICGMYQLFGNYFETSNGEKIKGLNILEAVKTVAGDERLIGNIVVKDDRFGDVVGYENHSGQTYLSGKVKPFGKVKNGCGNNMTGSSEGAIYKNIIGTYLHGPILPKNPRVTLFLIEKALENKKHELPAVTFENIEEKQKLKRITKIAKEIAKSRPR